MAADFFVHPLALVESTYIGLGTRIWAFAHVLEGARIGRDCNIGDHVFIEGGAVLGDRVTVKNGVQIWRGVEIADDVFLGPNTTLTNDLWPRSRRPWKLVPTYIRRGASIGANATILCGITLGEYCSIGAGAVVTRDVPPFTLMVGNPARAIGYVCRCGARLEPAGPGFRCTQCGACDIMPADHP